MILRPAQPEDWPAIWAILQPIFAAGETYIIDPLISESDAQRYWTELPLATYVAEEAGVILGTYYLKPNQPGPGSHICNCGYAVSEAARGKGMASAMCLHSQDEARAAGFLAMQFNSVVASNTGAVRLWQKLGYEIVGTVPGAFRHPTLGLTDTHVMHKAL